MFHKSTMKTTDKRIHFPLLSNQINPIKEGAKGTPLTKRRKSRRVIRGKKWAPWCFFSTLYISHPPHPSMKHAIPAACSEVAPKKEPTNLWGTHFLLRVLNFEVLGRGHWTKKKKKKGSPHISHLSPNFIKLSFKTDKHSPFSPNR